MADDGEEAYRLYVYFPDAASVIEVTSSLDILHRFGTIEAMRIKRHDQLLSVCGATVKGQTTRTVRADIEKLLKTDYAFLDIVTNIEFYDVFQFKDVEEVSFIAILK